MLHLLYNAELERPYRLKSMPVCMVKPSLSVADMQGQHVLHTVQSKACMGLNGSGCCRWMRAASQPRCQTLA